MKLNKLHSDERGEIYLIKGFKKFEEVTMFTTKANKARGGCIHNINDEHYCVLEGQIEYIIGDNRLLLSTGDSGLIPKSTPHYFVAFTDCVVIEWGATPAEKKNKHPEFRKTVDKINREKNE